MMKNTHKDNESVYFSSSEKEDVVSLEDNSSSSTATSNNSTPSTPNTMNNKKKKEDPAACVFVASLNKNVSNEELQTSVHDHFRKWGELTDVKVLQDWLKRPYAFVQYENEEDSKLALIEAPGTIINGRSVRCEPARVNRTICLISFNQPFNKQFLGSKLSMFGEIEDICILQPNGKFHYVFIKYKYRDDAIKTYLTLKCSDGNKYNWFVEWASNLDVNNMCGGGIYGASLSSRHLDKFSIFIGNLHESVTDAELKEEFSTFGIIMNTHVIRKPYNYNHKRVFAFIKYQNEGEAARAIDHENGRIWKDKVLKVCYREYHRNHQYNNITTTTTAFNYWYYYDSNNKQATTTYYYNNNNMMGQQRKKNQRQIMTTVNNTASKKSTIADDNNNNSSNEEGEGLVYKPYPTTTTAIASNSSNSSFQKAIYSYNSSMANNNNNNMINSSSAENLLFNSTKNNRYQQQGIIPATYLPPFNDNNGLFNTPPYYVADPYSTTTTTAAAPAPMVYYPYPVPPYYFSYNMMNKSVNQKEWQNQ